jgi:hypothetical protein
MSPGPGWSSTWNSPEADSSDAYVLLDQRDVVEVRAVGADIVRHFFSL